MNVPLKCRNIDKVEDLNRYTQPSANHYSTSHVLMRCNILFLKLFLRLKQNKKKRKKKNLKH